MLWHVILQRLSMPLRSNDGEDSNYTRNWLYSHESLTNQIDLDRCGYGPRLPFLVVSPHAKVNFVEHKLTDQTSIIRFIEDN